jgi:hypothetical protein
MHWALDETGTVDTSLLCNSSNENSKQIALVGQQERNRVMEIGIPEEILQIHGVTLASKPEGVIRLIYENVNSISNKLSKKDKVEKSMEIIDKLDVDIVAYNEHNLNMQDWQSVNSFNQLFKEGEVAIQSVVVHNIHKNIGRVQEGGTSLMVIQPLMEYIKNDQLGKDKTVLSWWSLMIFKGDIGRTQVVCGYNPCYTKNPDRSMTYQQSCMFLSPRRRISHVPKQRSAKTWYLNYIMA